MHTSAAHRNTSAASRIMTAAYLRVLSAVAGGGGGGGMAAHGQRVK
jgi:hypothetical protein